MAKGKKHGLSIYQTWEQLFIQNETKKKPDAELIKVMQAEFPDKKEKTTITNPQVFRSMYNNGTGLFQEDGPAGSKSRPISYRYDSNGNRIEKWHKSVSATGAKKKKTGKTGKKTKRPKVRGKTNRKAGAKRK